MQEMQYLFRPRYVKQAQKLFTEANVSNPSEGRKFRRAQSVVDAEMVARAKKTRRLEFALGWTRTVLGRMQLS